MTPAHTRVTFSGTFGADAAPVEAWSFGLNFSPPVTPTGEGRGQIAADAAAAYQARLAPILGDYSRLRQVKVAAIGSDGTYSDDPSTFDTNVAGANTAARHPFQVSLVVSLVTATRGSKGRGRFYLPAPAFSVQAADGLITASDQTIVAQRAAQFTEDLNAEVGLGSLVVASTSGILSTVTGIRVGRALDTLRSRRRSLPELYTDEYEIALSTS